MLHVKSMELPSNGLLLPKEPNWGDSQSRKTVQKIATTATTTIIIIVVIVAIEAKREIPLQYGSSEHQRCGRHSVTLRHHTHFSFGSQRCFGLLVSEIIRKGSILFLPGQGYFRPLASWLLSAAIWREGFHSREPVSQSNRHWN